MKSIYLRSNYVTRKLYKIFFFALLSLRMLNLSLNELKQITKIRHIQGYNNVSKERLLSILSGSESVKSLDNIKTKKIREDFNISRHKFSKSEIKEIRKNFYEIETKNNIWTQKIKEIEKSFSAFKKYHDHDDAKYVGIRDVKNLFDQSNDKGYYKPIKTKSAFNSNYIEYESNGDKVKIYQLKNVLIWSDHI